MAPNLDAMYSFRSNDVAASGAAVSERDVNAGLLRAIVLGVKASAGERSASEVATAARIAPRNIMVKLFLNEEMDGG
eukprot:12556252-Ditylum_brightwellii.AAC.1